MDLTNKIEGLNHQKIKKDKKLVLISLYDLVSQALRLLSTFLKEEGFSVSQVYFEDLFTKKFPYTEKEHNGCRFRDRINSGEKIFIELVRKWVVWN